MTSEERIESLKVQISDIHSRYAHANDILLSEISFLRRLVAMKFGLDEKQISQLFNSGSIGGVVGRPFQ